MRLQLGIWGFAKRVPIFSSEGILCAPGSLLISRYGRTRTAIMASFLAAVGGAWEGGVVCGRSNVWQRLWKLQMNRTTRKTFTVNRHTFTRLSRTSNQMIISFTCWWLLSNPFTEGLLWPLSDTSKDSSQGFLWSTGGSWGLQQESGYNEAFCGQEFAICLEETEISSFFLPLSNGFCHDFAQSLFLHHVTL